MTDKKQNRLPLIALAALPLSLGLVFAQTTPQRVQPTQPGQVQNAPRGPQQGTQPGQNQQRQNQQRQQSGTNYADVFVQKLAASLGVSVDKLKAAAVSAGSSTIDQGVQAGDFASDRAQDMKQKLQENPFALAGGRGGHRHREMERDGDAERGPGRGPAGQVGQMQGGPRLGRGSVMSAVAGALGLDEQALMQQLRSGQSIADLARARGVSTTTIHSAAVAALKTDLAAAVKDGRLTQTQADQMVQQAQEDANFGLQPGGRGGRGMRGGPNGNVQQSQDTQGAASGEGNDS